MAAPVLGIKEVCKDCELITLTENMLTGLSCVWVVIILHSAAAVEKAILVRGVSFICLRVHYVPD